MCANNQELVVDHFSDLSSALEPILFRSFHFLQHDLFLQVRILDDLVLTFFGFLLGWPSTCLCANEHLSPNLQPDSDSKNWHSGRCQSTQSDLVQIPFKWSLHGCRSKFTEQFRPPGFFFLDVHFCLLVLVTRRTEQFFGIGFHDDDSRVGNWNNLLSNTDLLFSKDGILLVLLQDHGDSCYS